MINHVCTMCSMLWVGGLFGQTSVVLSPSRDTPFAFHDNYSTANTNYNNAVQFAGFAQPGNSGGMNTGRAAIDFDLSSIPSGSTIFGAFLNLSAIGPFGVGQAASVGHTGQNECTISRITSSWDENTLTWNNQPTTTTLNAVTLDPSTYALQNYLFLDVTTLVQDMYDMPTTSHGLMLKLVNESATRSLAFYGSLAPEEDKRPELLVVYGECSGMMGVGDTEKLNDALLITPNITVPGGIVTVDLATRPVGSISMELTDQTGRVIEKNVVKNWPYAYNVPAFAAGSYVMTIRDNSNKAIAFDRLVIH